MRLSQWLMVAIVAFLPFELRTTSPYPSQLQALFFLLAIASLPLVIRNARGLVANPIVVAVLIFTAIQWACALIAVDFGANTIKAALRYTAGAWLVCAVLTAGDRRQLLKAWSVASIAAGAYALVDYSGHGFPALFRDVEFYFHAVQRLSGSFEYANTAAAYFAISLPIVWISVSNRILRIGGSALLWSALLLTFSRGAVVAVLIVLAIYSLRSRSYKPAALAGLGMLVYAVFAIHRPVLVKRVSGPALPPALAAEYVLEYNHLSEKPDVAGEMPVVLRNPGPERWRADGEGKVTLSYHWYHTGQRRILNTQAIETVLPRDVADGDSIKVNGKFTTPDVAGLYLLSWDMKMNGEWFSSVGIPVAAAEADVRLDADGRQGNVDVRKWYRRKWGDVPRQELWRAAVALVKSSPLLGVGPDNFRTMYGRVLGFGEWDTKIHSNSMYLELLTGSGIVGLCGFLFLISRIRWTATPATAAVAVSLVHGFVDSFLMTTPIYFGFWLLIGCASGGADESRV